MSDVMTGVPVTMSTGTSTGLAALVVLRPRGSGEGSVASVASDLGSRDDRLRRREVLLHHLELQRRRRARRSA